MMGMPFGQVNDCILDAMADRAIHISETEAASNLAEVLARAGAEVVIESGTLPVAVVRLAEPNVRLLSQSLRLAKEHASRPRSTEISPKM